MTLYIRCKSRQADLGEFLCCKNHQYPPALSDYGKIWKPTTKSDFLKCLYQEKGPSGEKVSVRYERPKVDVIVADGAAMV